MLSTYAIILALAFISGLTTLLGVLIALKLKKSAKAIAVGLGFAAGIMLWISLFELIPESFASIGILKSTLAVFFGVLLIAVLNQAIPHSHLCQEKGRFENRLLKTAYLCALGLILHDFPEGFTMANSYFHSPNLGLLIALSIALHNIPEEFAIAIPITLTQTGKKLLFKTAFISGLAEPAGALIGILAVHIMPKLTPIFLSFAAGAMVYISVHELIPTARLYERKSLIVLGMFFSFLVYLGLTILIPG